MKFEKIIMLLLTAALFACFAGTAFAAYTLNPEVKDATPALIKASQIGVRINENKALAAQPNKDAILVMSFGTTFKDSREKTIDKTVADIKAAHPGTKVVLAFTSHIIVDRIKAKEGLTIPTPEEALAQLKKDGYTRIALTTLDIFPGMEYDYDAAVYDLYKDQFKKMTLGIPIMYWMGQEEQADDVAEFVKAYATQFPKLNASDALVVMAHGTPHPSNAYYSVVQTRFDRAKLGNVYIYTVEGWPNIETVMEILKAKNVKNVTMMPMMMVAGDHANNDMAGDEPDSHKNLLKKAGFSVTTYIHGLGENAAIRKLFVSKADEAWNALESEQKSDKGHKHMK
jgi:sirohydrochlorin cobaltochelatase